MEDSSLLLGYEIGMYKVSISLVKLTMKTGFVCIHINIFMYVMCV